jgi:hypothetical protein
VIQKEENEVREQSIRSRSDCCSDVRLHILASGTLTHLTRLAGASRFDPRRFRPTSWSTPVPKLAASLRNRNRHRDFGFAADLKRVVKPLIDRPRGPRRFVHYAGRSHRHILSTAMAKAAQSRAALISEHHRVTDPDPPRRLDIRVCADQPASPRPAAAR